MKKIYQKYLQLLVLSCIIMSCNNQQKSEIQQKPFEIDLTRSYEKTDIQLNDILDNINIIRLETNEDSYLDRFRGFVGEKYIVSIGYEKMMLFSENGKYLTTIAIKGKGPGEFTQIDAWTVNENERYLFFHDYSKNYFFKYNLEKQELEKNIPFKDEGYLSGLIYMNDTTFAVLPGPFSSYDYLYFIQSINGEILRGISQKSETNPGIVVTKSPILQKINEESFYCQPSGSDTIFSLVGTTKEAWIILKLIPSQKKGELEIVESASVLYSNNKKTFIQKVIMELKISETMASARPLSNENYIYDKKTQSIKEIENVFLKYEDVQLNIHELNFHGNSRYVYPLIAMDFKELLEENIQNSNLQENEIAKLKLLNSQISIEDNPIIITGICKN